MPRWRAACPHTPSLLVAGWRCSRRGLVGWLRLQAAVLQWPAGLQLPYQFETPYCTCRTGPYSHEAHPTGRTRPRHPALHQWGGRAPHIHPELPCSSQQLEAAHRSLQANLQDTACNGHIRPSHRNGAWPVGRHAQAGVLGCSGQCAPVSMRHKPILQDPSRSFSFKRGAACAVWGCVCRWAPRC